ncbi:MAG: alpha-2,8-polysialyltransferase family protein [Prevotella sp.]|nr:alpha-2,8-polysialyltransferase family protein [Prevotella sp.]
MKHLFFIHSHTLFLTAIGTIEKLKLNDNDVIFVYSRHYSNNFNFPYKCFDFTNEVESTFYMMFSWSRKHFGINKALRDKNIKFFDDFVEKEIKGDYKLYVSMLQAVTFQIFATNRHCVECFFLQEGGRIMYDVLTDKIKWPFRLYNKLVLRNENRFWKCTNWFPSSHTPYNKPVTVFAFDERYFGNMPSKIIKVNWPKLKPDVDIDNKFPIFTLEGAVELGQVQKNVYMRAVDNLIASCAKEKNYIKFHPIQSEIIKTQYKKMFTERGLQIIELPMNIPFELIVASFSNLTVCGFGTSLLFYAKAFGHNVISHEDELIKNSLRYRIYCKKLSTL